MLELLCLSVPTSLRMQQLDSYRSDFREILYCRFVLKFAYKFKFWLKWGKSNKHFLHEYICMFMIFGYYSYVGYHVPSITVARFVSTVTQRPMTLWPCRLLTLHIGEVYDEVFTNPRRHFSVTTIFSTVAHNICGFLVWDLLQVTLQELRTSRRVLKFWEICALQV
jgi:hypothetical protein